MNTQQLQLVTFEQAKRLKELGFNFACREYYDSKAIFYYDAVQAWDIDHNSEYISKGGYDRISAPTVSLALKWFRDVKKAIYIIALNEVEAVYCGEILGIDVDCRGSSDTYEAAESALLDELLTLFEKK